jgi:asparagine synthase (glutamine-hydrolysing)
MRADLLELRIPYWCNLMDKNMMNVPVEVRMPYLDKNFLDFIFTVPDRLMLRNGYTKYLLREVLKPMLPPDIVWQKKKVGFSAPPKTFGRGEFEISNDIFDYPGLENYFDLQHVKTHLHTLDSKLSWRIFNFAKWYGLNNL